MKIECPNCGMDSAYYDTIDEVGTYYYCPDCDYNWCDDTYKMMLEDFDFEDEVEMSEPISKYLISSVYSPRKKYIRILELCREDMDEEYGDLEHYSDDVAITLLQTQDYSKLTSIDIPEGITRQQSDEILNRQIMHFLETEDELSAFPTAKEWASFINAPEELISKILADFDPVSSIVFMLPDTYDIEFVELFRSRFEEFQLHLKNQDEIEQIPNFDRLINCFYSIIEPDCNSLSYEDSLVVDKLMNFLKRELKVIYNYIKEVRNKESESLANLVTKCKENNLSKRDAIVFILDNYLNDLYE